MRRSTLAAAASFATVALLVSGCGSSGNDAGGQPSPSPSTATAMEPSAPSSAATSASGSTPGAPVAGGTTKATPTTSLLKWTKLSGDPNDTVTTNGTWTLTVAQEGGWWSLGHGNGTAKETHAPAGLEVQDATLSDDWAVVVYGDENGNKPQRAVVTALSSGKVTTIDKSSDLPPASDGSWALDGSTLWHATIHAGAYCLASTDLTSGTSKLSWCAPARHGFTNVLSVDGQTSMMTFDDKQPSCRTIVTVSGRTTTPYPGVQACKGAQGALLTSTAKIGRIWSVVPNENRYQQVHMYGATDAGTQDLGLGVNGTLTVCGSAAYWSRDVSGSTPAALMRWDGSQLSVVYQSKGFLGAPQCAGHQLTVLDTTDNSAAQLTAHVS